MTCSAGSAKALVGLTLCASVPNVACQDDGVLELFPRATNDPCSLTGAGGAIDSDEAEECSLGTALVHRYSFSALGSTAEDSVGSADGSIVNATVATEGQLTLEGVDSEQYVDLPNGVIDGLTDATFEAWVEWDGGAVWQRIFDFGNSHEGEDIQGGGSTYLFLTPSHIYGSLWLAHSLGGPDQETVVDAGMPLPTGTSRHVAAVIDDTNDTMSLYLDGNLEASTTFTRELSGIDNVNNWLGRSQFIIDADFSGTFDEFRIYRAALTAAQVAASYERGPDATFREF